MVGEGSRLQNFLTSKQKQQHKNNTQKSPLKTQKGKVQKSWKAYNPVGVWKKTFYMYNFEFYCEFPIFHFSNFLHAPK